MWNPRSRSDFYQSKSGSFFKEKPTWRLLLFKETTLGLQGGEALGLSTIGGAAPAIRSCRLDVASQGPASQALRALCLPTVCRISPSTSYSVHPVLEPYFSHCCPSGEDCSSLPLGSQSSGTFAPHSHGVHFQILNQLTLKCHSRKEPSGDFVLCLLSHKVCLCHSRSCAVSPVVAWLQRAECDRYSQN